MSNEDETDTKKPGTLGLRAGGNESGRVKQSFSHGRSKSVVVEKRRTKRVLKPIEGGGATKGPDSDTSKLRRKGAPEEQARKGAEAKPAQGKPRGKPQFLKTLSDDERARREKALEAAKAAKIAADKKAEAQRKVEAEAAAQADAEAKAAAEAQADDAAAVEVSPTAAAEPDTATEAAQPDAPASEAETDAPPAAETEVAKAPAAAGPKIIKAATPETKAAAKPAAKATKSAAKDAPTRKERGAKQPRLARPSDAAIEAAKRAASASPEKKDDQTAGRKRDRADESVKTGDQVDISSLTEALPGPKIISRAPPKPKQTEEIVERSRPRPGEDHQDAGGAGPGPSGPGAPRGGVRAPKQNERDDRSPRNTRGAEAKRRSGKLTITQATSGNEGRTRSMASMRRRQERERRKQSGPAQPAQKVYREVKIPDAITVQELSNRMTERGGDVVKSLMAMGMMVTINQSIDAETAELIVQEFGHTAVRVSEADVDIDLAEAPDPDGSLAPRAPIVTIMGHVDHGKTSLLDKLRNANVVSGEAGGITQHIGAYQVKSDSGAVTFLDTPGHAAFTAMRSRGAQATDIVILVVAADDAVMPQTIEAISHAKAAEVPMIVAINKIDKPAADANKVRTDLLQHDVQVEGMGGEVLDVEVSAITGQGLDTLLESVILQSEILDLKANPDREAEGIVVEAQLDVGRGPVATVLVKRGTLKTGDIFVVGEQWGRVRALINDHGDRVKEAGPSVPVEVLGLNGTPEAGDSLVVVGNEKRALEVAEYRQRLAKEKQAAIGTGRTLDQMLAQAKADEETAELPVVIKADVQGSAEAIIQAMEKIGNDEVRVRVLHSGVGAITESDVTLAEASGAAIIGFNVRANSAARDASNQKSVEIRYYSIIYDLVDDVKAAAAGLLSPEVKETFIGYAEILQTFRVSGVGTVAGCRITEGVARRSAGVRLLRDNVVIHEGTLKTLKRFKDEVKEVPSGQECGMAFEKYDDIREGDVIEIFETQEIERTLA